MGLVQTNKASRYERQARLCMESYLDFKSADQNYLLVSEPSPLSRIGTGDFTLSFFLLVKTAQTMIPFYTIGSGVYIYISIASNRILSLRVLSSLGNTKSAFSTKALMLNNFTFITIKRQGTGLFIFQNNEAVFQDAAFFVAGESFSTGSDVYIGSKNNNTNFVNGGISHFIFCNKALSIDEGSFMHTNGGVVQASAHASVQAHYPLTQRTGKKAFDVVEQYNYARPWSIPRFDAGTWTWTSNDPAYSITGNALSYDGTATGARTAGNSISNILTADNTWVRVRFNVTALTGAGLQIFIGGAPPAANKITINSTGVKEIYLKKESGHSSTLYFSNAASITATWTVADIEILPYEANHADLINFEHKWYANHAFDSNGYTGVLYSTMSTYLPVAGVSVNFNVDNVEYLATENATTTTGLKVLPFFNVETGKTYVIAIDWEYNKAGVSAGINIHLENTGDIVSKTESFARVTEQYEVTSLLGGARGFYVRYKTGVNPDDSIKIYSVKIWEKNKERDVDSSPTGIPDPATNTSWADFYRKDAVLNGLCFSKVHDFSKNTIAYCFVSNPENLGSATTGLMPSNSSFNITFVGSFIGATSGSFSGGGQVIFAFNTAGSYLALRSQTMFRLTQGSQLIDFYVPANFGQAIFFKRPFVLNVRYNNATSQVFFAFRFLDSVTVTRQTFSGVNAWSRGANNPAIASIGSSLAPIRLTIQDSFVDDTVENEALSLNYGSLTPFLDWDFQGFTTPTAIDKIGNLTPRLYRHTNPQEYVSQATFDSLINPIVEAKTGMPRVKLGLPLSTTKVITIPQAAMAKIGNGNYLDLYITFSFNSGYFPLISPESNRTIYDFKNTSNSERTTLGAARLATATRVSSQYFISGDSGSSYRDFQPSDENKIVNLFASQFGFKHATGDRTAISQYISGIKTNQLSTILGKPPFLWSGFDNNIITGDITLYQITAVWRLSSDKNIDTREALSQNDNSLLSNAKKNIAWAYSAVSAFEDGTNVKLTDLSGNGNHAIVTGFAGATSADQLIDLKSNLVDINDLR